MNSDPVVSNFNEKTEQVCPFCKETIKKEAVKCRYCHSMLGEEPKPKKSTYVLDSDQVRFITMAASILGMFVIIGLSLYNIDIKELRKGYENNKIELEETRDEFRDERDALHKEIREDQDNLGEEIADLNEIKVNLREQIDELTEELKQYEDAEGRVSTIVELVKRDRNRSIDYLNATRGLFDEATGELEKLKGTVNNIEVKVDNPQGEGIPVVPAVDEPVLAEAKTYVVEQDEETAQHLIEQGIAEYDSANLEKAIENYNRAIELEPNNAQAFFNRGIAYIDLGDKVAASENYTKAIEDFEQVIELDPVNEAQAYYNMGNAFFKSGNLSQAIENHTFAIKKYEEASDSGDEAVDLDESIALAYNNRGAASFRQKNYQLAIDDYEKARSLGFSNPLTYSNLGFAYFRSGNLTLAIENFVNSIGLNPDDARTQNNICWVGSLAERDKIDDKKVIEYCERAIELNPGNGLYRDSRGLARALRGFMEGANEGDIEGAIEDFNYYLNWVKVTNRQNSTEQANIREQWIEQLEKGENPFDEATLEDLRGGETN